MTPFFINLKTVDSVLKQFLNIVFNSLFIRNLPQYDLRRSKLFSRDR